MTVKDWWNRFSHSFLSFADFYYQFTQISYAEEEVLIVKALSICSKPLFLLDKRSFTMFQGKDDKENKRSFAKLSRFHWEHLFTIFDMSLYCDCRFIYFNNNLKRLWIDSVKTKRKKIISFIDFHFAKIFSVQI